MTTPAAAIEQQIPPAQMVSSGSNSTNAGKRTSTIESLTSTLQSSNLADKDSLAYREIDSLEFKKLILKEASPIEDEKDKGTQIEDQSASSSSSSSHLPPLRVLLHDRIWAQGGEVVMQLGVSVHPQHDSDGQPIPAPRKLEGIEHINVEFTAEELQDGIKKIAQACSEAGCESVVLHQTSNGNENCAFLMLRRIPSGAQELLELRVAVIGNGECQRPFTESDYVSSALRRVLFPHCSRCW
jgi:hypothetical protein